MINNPKPSMTPARPKVIVSVLSGECEVGVSFSSGIVDVVRCMSVIEGGVCSVE